MAETHGPRLSRGSGDPGTRGSEVGERGQAGVKQPALARCLSSVSHVWSAGPWGPAAESAAEPVKAEVPAPHL